MMRAWRIKHHNLVRDSWLRQTYGTSLHVYNKMFAKQGGVCAICHQEPNGKRAQDRVLQVDHDHRLGKTRPTVH